MREAGERQERGMRERHEREDGLPARMERGMRGWPPRSDGEA